MVFMTTGSFTKVEVLQNAPFGAFCNTFDLLYINYFLVLLRVAVLHKFYCSFPVVLVVAKQLKSKMLQDLGTYF